MNEIEKYARAAASTARTPPNSPARQAAIEAENTARVAAEQFVKGLEAERDELRARLDALCDAPDGVLLGRVARLPHQELRELSRAIEAASLAANNLGVRRG